MNLQSSKNLQKFWTLKIRNYQTQGFHCRTNCSRGTFKYSDKISSKWNENCQNYHGNSDVTIKKCENREIWQNDVMRLAKSMENPQNEVSKTGVRGKLWYFTAYLTIYYGYNEHDKLCIMHT